MPDNQDKYDRYYADKLWHLLPEVYRALDSPDFDRNGPLHEMVNRIGAQAAILRRSLDRQWEDQSIETCDDWVIPYIADLLATRLVASLDARGQRLDVAKTIYYRRRKGTVAILEEIAADITGWDARVVEFFRRLSRTRHNFDPEIGLPAETPDPNGNRALQYAEGLIGRWTRAAIGGTADVRNVYGATRTQTAFDEFFHTADVRRGRGQVGWHTISHLGVFLWRLQSFPVGETTPVPVQACPGQFTFDPTGRDMPLFAGASRSLGDTWVSPAEWQLPTPISRNLLQAYLMELYAALDPEDGVSVLPNSLGVFQQQGSFYDLVTVDQITADPRQMSAAFFIDPERGRLISRSSAAQGALRVTYHYGFASSIGAGPYDRRLLGRQPTPLPGVPQVVTGGGNALVTPLAAIAATGTVTLDDCLTYDAVSTVTGIANVTLRANNYRRPVIRLPVPPNNTWTLDGAPALHPGAPDGTLRLDGLFISGGDIVLTGQFDTVTLTCCTLDPGDFDTVNNVFRKAADGRDLLPCHLRVEGSVRQLWIDRSIVGSIRTVNTGNIETLIITDSIVQAVNGAAEKAIALESGEVNLSRCTLLGPAHVHRLDASECIFDAVVSVEDQQHGCVRFSAWATGSKLPRRYESVEIRPGSALFASRVFGHPGYCQLLPGVDVEIVPPMPPPLTPPAVSPSISAGAQDGSEMGAFAREKYPIKERSLRIKYEEYMPLGLTPVLIYVT